MDELPTGDAQSLGADSELASTVPVDAMSGAADADAPQLLDVQMDELARTLTLITIGRLRR
jgi:CO/xanthine dehydrogenase Mo-binding subunit